MNQQQQPLSPLQVQIDAIVGEFATQRDYLSGRAGNLAGQLALAQLEIATLKEKIQKLESEQGVEQPTVGE